MELSEHKTYRTRDGLRTGIRVEKISGFRGADQYRSIPDRTRVWTPEGQSWGNPGPWDLIEEQPATPQPFSYDACPVGEDGRRRAVTRDGREVVLLCDDAPGARPVVGIVVTGDYGADDWYTDGRSRFDGLEAEFDLLIPPRPKRVVWVNQYERKEDADAADRLLSANTDHPYPSRLGNRAYPIEIDL